MKLKNLKWYYDRNAKSWGLPFGLKIYRDGIALYFLCWFVKIYRSR